MPTLRIIVFAPPREFEGAKDLRLTMSSKSGEIEAKSEGDSLIFEAEFEMKADRSGTMYPSGLEVVHHGDKRRFIYLNWWGETAEGYRCFRRMKVFFERIPNFGDGMADQYEVFIKGTDKRGGPACASVELLPSDKQ